MGACTRGRWQQTFPRATVPTLSRPPDRPTDADVFFRCEPGELDYFSSSSSYQSLDAQRAPGIYHCRPPLARCGARLRDSGCTTRPQPTREQRRHVHAPDPSVPPHLPRLPVDARLHSLTMIFCFCRRRQGLYLRRSAH